MAKTVHKVEKITYHRNGIGGQGFHVVLFKETRKGPRMLGVVFDNDDGCIRTAVFDLDLLSQGVIEFAKNSFRGDHFDRELRAAILADEEG